MYMCIQLDEKGLKMLPCSHTNPATHTRLSICTCMYVLAAGERQIELAAVPCQNGLTQRTCSSAKPWQGCVSIGTIGATQ